MKKTVTGKEFCKILESHGWELKRINGSHHIYAKMGKDERISVPVHGGKSMKRGLLNRPMKTAGIDGLVT